MKKYISIFLILVILTLGYFYLTNSKSLQGEGDYIEVQGEEVDLYESGTAKAIEDPKDLWNLYEGSSFDFSFKYPHNVSIEDGYDIKMSVKETKLSDIDMPGFKEAEAKSDSASLKQGVFGEGYDWSLSDSEKIRNIGEVNAQDYVVFSRFEVCDVVFERVLVFYFDEYQIEIKLSAEENRVVESMPEYFTKDKDNCGDDLIWDFEKQGEFYQSLVKGEGSQYAQEWFTSFDEIVKTIEIYQKADSYSLLQGKWVSVDDEKSEIEFKDGLKVDYYDGEFMAEGSIELIGKNLLVDFESEVFEYVIIEIDKDKLVLSYKDSGRTLKYKR